MPDKKWISNSLKILEQKNLRGILGKTRFIATNDFEDCFISATYGYVPLNSVPGTLIEKSLLKEIGFFVPNNRSGEDAEWINRSKNFYPNLIQPHVFPCNYIGLKGKIFIDLCKKWYHYYSTVNSRFYSQKIIYISFAITSLLLLAFNWNVKIANFDQSSIFYIPHLSKIIVSLIVLFYLIYRMIILPIRKNVKVFSFGILKFAKFFLISIILDLIKLIAFINRKKKY